jgi:purine-nucleoside phosphorylase
LAYGEVAEWSIAFDLKSNEPKGSVGSNPTLSALILPMILVPQGAEYRAVCRGVRQLDQPPQVVAIPVGIASVTRFLHNFQERDWGQNILVMGLCGSLTGELQVGDAVLYRDCVDLESICQCATQRFQGQLVRGLTSDRILTAAAEKLTLGQLHQAQVVDMEGSAILKILSSSGVAISMLRVVSDDVRHDLPDLTGMIDAEGRLRSFPLALSLLRQPIAATRLIRGSLKALRVLENLAATLPRF